MDNPFLYQPPKQAQMRFAVVTAVVGSKYRLKIDVNPTAGQKLYPYIGNDALAVGDKVSLQRVSGTYIITGRIN